MEYMEYEQHLTPDMKKLLESAEFKPLFDRIMNDDELRFEIRKGSPIVYYLGCKIIEINSNRNKTLRLNVDYKYAKKTLKKSDNAESEYFEDRLQLLNNLNLNSSDFILWKEKLDEVKTFIDYYRNEVVLNCERQKQQKIASANNDFAKDVVILDTEYAVREKHCRKSKLCKVDMIGVCKNENGSYDIVLIELKVGDHSLNGAAGVEAHIKDFEKILGSRKEDIVKSVENIFQIKKDYRLLKNCPEKINISKNFIAVVLAYGLEKRKEYYKREFMDNQSSSTSYKLKAVLMDNDTDILTKSDLL